MPTVLVMCTRSHCIGEFAENCSRGHDNGVHRTLFFSCGSNGSIPACCSTERSCSVTPGMIIVVSHYVLRIFGLLASSWWTVCATCPRIFRIPRCPSRTTKPLKLRATMHSGPDVAPLRPNASWTCGSSRSTPSIAACALSHGSIMLGSSNGCHEQWCRRLR